VTLAREQLSERARRVRAVVLDVDGVLTDAGLYYSARGESLKRFSARDGFAIKVAQREGIQVAVLTGRVSAPMRARARDLGIDEGLVIQGSRQKAGDLALLADRLGVPPDGIAFMGDDLPDLPALAAAGLAACPADAVPEVRARCHLVCAARSGNGAVRELVEVLLAARGRWEQIVAEWAAGTAELSPIDRRGAAARRGDGT
jgi:3-deoxy-D-manno-octulosonate 8-phosphate phosphatase (KDO 8-P phosphatase)